jgi:hypothetical protein
MRASYCFVGEDAMLMRILLIPRRLAMTIMMVVVMVDILAGTVAVVVVIVIVCDYYTRIQQEDMLDY